MPKTLAEIGELALLANFIQPFVTSGDDTAGDDCAHIRLGSKKLLWSMDPCPTPVAALLGVATPHTWGWYTAAINISDIAACGGVPLGLLVSLELRDDTEVSFVQEFQEGLRDALNQHRTSLLGGNVKSAPRFSATGTVLGTSGPFPITRSIAGSMFDAFLIGECGHFWAGVMGYAKGWGLASDQERKHLENAVLRPQAKVDAGLKLSSMGIPIACMDCSDGAANALFQLAQTNSINLVLEDAPDWAIRDCARSLLLSHEVKLENACYQFGDWQLACIVRREDRDLFVREMKEFALTYMGSGFTGTSGVRTLTGTRLSPQSLNQNFAGGYNSITGVEDLITRFMSPQIFI